MAGVDEAGRGPLAGPILAAAVVLPLNFSLAKLDDSKKLSPLLRARLFDAIKRSALDIGVGLASREEIDRLNIERANRLAMERAVSALQTPPDFILVDGGRKMIKTAIPQRPIIGGDGKSVSIAAASIIAKVTRDRLMNKYHRQYPQYRFDRHKGYGTEGHLRRLERFGPCPIHRRSFSPIKSA